MKESNVIFLKNKKKKTTNERTLYYFLDGICLFVFGKLFISLNVP